MFHASFEAKQQALIDFNHLLNKGARHRMIKALIGKSSDLMRFDSVREGYELRAQRDLGVQTVPVDAIIGTVGRIHEFDDAFYPKQEGSRHRWCDVAAAIYAGKDMPPIEVYGVDGAYYIIDGNHRISVMKALGQEYVDAHIIEIELGDNRCQTQAKPAPRFDR